MAATRVIFHLLLAVTSLHAARDHYRCLEDYPFSCGCIGDTIRCYGLESIPTLSKHLKQYIRIQIEDGGVDKLEKSFNEINLTSVTVSNMGLKEIADDAFRGLENSLNTLNLKNNELTTLPNINYLRKLKTLYLSHNKLLRLEPNAFEGLSGSLQTLDLGSNRLTEVPKAVRSLRSLNALSLSNNEIRDIDPEAFEGVGVVLRELFLRENRLTTIPLAINRLTNLWRLSLNHNMISGFKPEAMTGMENTLYEWQLNNNSLTEVPVVKTTFTELKILDLGDNKISRIDADAFFYMPNVNWLWINDNNLSVICPGSLDHLEKGKLIRLQFSWNFLAGFPESVFGNIASGPIYGISYESNPVHCGCGLAWLRNSTIRKGVNFPAFCASPPAYKKAEYTMLDFPIKTCTAASRESDSIAHSAMFKGCRPPSHHIIKTIESSSSRLSASLGTCLSFVCVLFLNLKS